MAMDMGSKSRGDGNSESVRGQITMSTGVATLIGAAISGAKAPEHSYLLNGGDLHQMSIHADFLSSRGFDVRLNNVYPSLKSPEEFKAALKAIYEAKLEGWWNYQDKLLNLEICSKDEFRLALNAECAKQRDR